MKKLLLLSGCLLVSLVCAQAESVSSTTTIRMTDKILVGDVKAFGINDGRYGGFCGAGGALKTPRVCNFEGTMFRICPYGELREDGFLCYFLSDEGKGWAKLKKTGMDKIMTGAKATILSEPFMWEELTITEVTGIDGVDVWDNKRTERRAFLKFDRKLDLPDGKPIKGIGIMLDKTDWTMGSLNTSYGYWCSESNTLAQGDVPPGSYGCSALLMDGTADAKKGSVYRIGGHNPKKVDVSGAWRLRLWVKIAEGDPSLTVDCKAGKQEVPLSSDWRQQDIELNFSGADGTDIALIAKGGKVLVDDVVYSHLEGDNPTAFTDEYVDTLKAYRPGILRTLQMGGSGVDNDVKPRLQAYGNSSTVYNVGPRGGIGVNLHQWYELCEYLDCEPWYNIPGTLYLEDIDNYMEYIGAPADVGYGKVRAQQGHPEPWTETLRMIHVEFGNEPWNSWGPFLHGGYDGPDYWRILIDRAKQSPYFKENVVFHAGIKGLGWSKPSELHKNADHYTIAPYVIQSLDPYHQEFIGDDMDKAFRFLFAQGVYYARKSSATAQKLFERGQEMSIYEVNHHFAVGKADMELKNTLLPSIGSGLNIANSMLIWLKENHCRNSCFFTMFGEKNTAYTSEGPRLFGACLSMKSGEQRLRPHWLALATLNRILSGDLVETAHEGADPVFTPIDYSKKQKKMFEVEESLPVLWSYGFADGQRRGLAIVSLATSQSHEISLAFDGVASGSATCWVMAADSITATNERDNPAGEEIQVREDNIDAFASGWTTMIPPHSLTVLQWTVD